MFQDLLLFFNLPKGRSEFIRLSYPLVFASCFIFFATPIAAQQFNPSYLLRNMPPLDLRHKTVGSKNVVAYFKHYGLEFKDVAHYFGHFKSAGMQIAGHVFIPAKTKGTVFFLHGYLDHTGLVAKLIGYLLDQEYTVATFDLPGHGLSSGERAAIDDFSQYVVVLKEFLKRVCPYVIKPFHVVGHSTGCAITFEFLNQSQGPFFDKIVFLAPLVHSAHWFKSKAGYYLAKSFTESVPRQFRENSSDEDFLEFVENDPLRIHRIPLIWAKALFSWNERIETYSTMRLSVFVIQGTADDIVDWRYNTAFLRRKFKHISFKYVRGAKHNLINERADLRKKVYEAISLYLRGSVKGGNLGCLVGTRKRSESI